MNCIKCCKKFVHPKEADPKNAENEYIVSDKNGRTNYMYACPCAMRVPKLVTNSEGEREYERKEICNHVACGDCRPWLMVRVSEKGV